MQLIKLVLLRHGVSQWNIENRFKRWTTVNLSKTVLRPANLTMDICLKEMNMSDIPIKYDWRLNERYYGALQGLNKLQTKKRR